MSLQMLPYNPPEIKVSVSCENAVYFITYLNKCHSEAFKGINDYTSIHPITEQIHRFNLVKMYYDLIYKAIAKPQRKVKRITIKLTYSEALTCSILFKRVQIPAILEALQYLIIKNLKP